MVLVRRINFQIFGVKGLNVKVTNNGTSHLTTKLIRMKLSRWKLRRSVIRFPSQKNVMSLIVVVKFVVHISCKLYLNSKMSGDESNIQNFIVQLYLIFSIPQKFALLAKSPKKKLAVVLN